MPMSTKRHAQECNGQKEPKTENPNVQQQENRENVVYSYNEILYHKLLLNETVSMNLTGKIISKRSDAK